jgi:hypothetical protein
MSNNSLILRISATQLKKIKEAIRMQQIPKVLTKPVACILE